MSLFNGKLQKVSTDMVTDSSGNKLSSLLADIMNQISFPDGGSFLDKFFSFGKDGGSFLGSNSGITIDGGAF